MSDTGYTSIGAGRMDKRITIWKQGGGTTTLGGQQSAYVVRTTAWAGLAPARGGEQWHAQHLQGKLGVVVTIRYTKALASAGFAECFVQYGTRWMKILAARDLDERHERFELACEELVGWQPPASP